MQKTQSLLVDIDEIKKASTPDRLRTSILFPCIGIIIYQTEQKIALAGHFIDPSIYGMDELIKIAKAELTDPSQQKIYIGGGSPTPDDDPGNVSDQARKKYVNQSLEQAGYQQDQISIKYNQANQTSTMSFDTVTGELTHKIRTIKF